MKTGKSRRSLFILLAIAIGLAGLLIAFRQPWFMESRGYVFLNGLLREFISPDGNSSLQRENRLPETLTDNQRHPDLAVPETAVNLLVIGPDASGANWDTLLIVSLEEATGTVRLINIPRDLYVAYAPAILAQLKEASPKTFNSVPARKINAAHLIGKRIAYREKTGRFSNPELDFTADLVQEILGIRIDDCIKTTPSGFRKIVDHFGGVTLKVPYRMKYADPIQKLRIDLQPGLQHLDGAQAEGFVRFRQGTDDKGKKISIGDVERKNNQTVFMRAFIEQHATAANLGRVSRLASDLGSWLETTFPGGSRLSTYAGIGLSMVGKGLNQVSVPLHTEDFKKEGIYFIRFITPETDKAE